jgi:hypothetical protein
MTLQPYRGMPLVYVVVWVAFTGLVVLYQSGVPESVGECETVAAGALVGGVLWLDTLALTLLAVSEIPGPLGIVS